MAEYLTTDTDLQSVADAIRAKGKTSAQLVWPAGYNAAINTINPLTLSVNTSGPSSIVTVNDATDLDAKQVVVGIEPVQAGSGDPSPTNVRPISGWTGAKVTRTGKNLYNANGINTLSVNGVTATVNNGVITFNGTATANAFFAVHQTGLLSGKYVFSFNNPVASNGVHVSFKTTSEEYFSDTSASEVNKSVAIRNEPSSVILYVTRGTTLTNFVIRPQLELGTTASAYEPYQGSTLSIAFPSGAGTVYGGTLDVTNGVLTVDRAMVDLGTLNWNYSGGSFNHRFSATMPSDYKMPPTAADRASFICSAYASNSKVVANTNELGASSYQNTSGLYIRDLAYSDAAAFKAAMSGVQLVYELATPVTYDLTPQDIELLSGYNVIFADCGDVALSYYTEDFADLADEIGFAEGGDY